VVVGSVVVPLMMIVVLETVVLVTVVFTVVVPLEMGPEVLIEVDVRVLVNIVLTGELVVGKVVNVVGTVVEEEFKNASGEIMKTGQIRFGQVGGTQPH
jgi:hypothetical protein